MSFISSYHERGRDKVLVWEKSESGKRIKREVDSPYNFYVPDKDGTFEAITGELLRKVEFDSKQEFDEGCRSFPTKFESDLHPQEKVMMSYVGKRVPILNVGFLDIEVDYDPKIGWPRADNPYAPISALTLYNTDVKAYFTLAIPPQGWLDNNCLPQDMVDDNYWLFDTERQLIETFISIITDIDVLSGWNSEFFDLPYIGKRMELLFGKHSLRQLAFEGGPTPRWGEKDRFKGAKQKEIVLELQSRVHLDYMALFKKFTLGGRQSFSLQAITEEELEVPKLHYEGTLYDLYRNDFIHFLKYNRHDVTCLKDLDKKFRYIELANTMVHEATVNFNAIFGSVQLIDTAIINFCHTKLNKIVFDKKHKVGMKVEGAVVMSPKIGLHKMIGSVDINSLYPSIYRSLNLSPEKIIGQLSEYEEGWRIVHYAHLHPEDDEAQHKVVTIIPEGVNPLDEDGEEVDAGLEITAGNMVRFLKDNKYAL
jgi:DNA polymerase elongation subunit (family B)